MQQFATVRIKEIAICVASLRIVALVEILCHDRKMRNGTIDAKTALAEARQFAAALDGPLGRRPIEAVMREHRTLFDNLRAAGASWPQIATLLLKAGACTGRGSPIPANALRAMASRL